MILEIIIIAIYSTSLALIFMYALAQLNLLLNYLSAHKKDTHLPPLDIAKENELPTVTIQLPVYNEMYVMDRLLENIATMTYPKHKLEIQVLDDSTDETVEILKNAVAKIRKQGIDIFIQYRDNRNE